MLKKLLIFIIAGMISLSAFAATAFVDSRPTQIDISSATSESAVLMTVSGYTSDDARYRLYNGSNQYNCWDSATSAYITSTSYSSGPRVPGTPTTSSTWWILFQRGNNIATAASYRDRLGTAYSSNYMTAALPTATAITTPVSITNSNVTFTTWNTFTEKYVILAYDATSGGTLISATSSALSTGAFDLKVETGTTIHRIEVRNVTNTLIESVTGTWPAAGTPTISVVGTLTAFSTALGTPSASQTYTLSGSNLTANIVVTPPTGFELSSNGTAYSSSLSLVSTYNGLVYVRLTGAAAGTFSGNITHTSTGATQVDLAASGTVTNPSAPVIHVTGTLTKFTMEQGTPSASQSYTLSGENLTANIAVTPPTGYQVSTDDASWMSSLSLASGYNGLVYVRLNGSNITSYNGNITHTSGSAPQVDLAATGMVFETTPSTLLLIDNFYYDNGLQLNATRWTASSGTTNYVTVQTGGLTYAGYPSTSGNSVNLAATGEDVYRLYTAQTANSVYASALINITSVSTTGDYFLHLASNPWNSSNYRARVFAQADALGAIRFGLTNDGAVADAVWTDYVYAAGTTYLLVVKYDILDGTNNDVSHLFVNPVFSGAEPAYTLTATDATVDVANIGAIQLRQGTTTPVSQIDGLRIADSWYHLWGTTANPQIIVTGAPDPVYNIVGNPSEEISFYTLQGSQLSGPIDIVAPTPFEISTTGTDGWASSLQVPMDYNGPIYVRLYGTEVGEHGGNITHNSIGATQVNVRVDGETFPADVTWNINSSMTAFAQELGSPSAAQSYTMSATNATGGITVSVPAPFELSTTGTSNWLAELTLANNFNGSIYVRLNATAAGDYNQNILHVTANATNYELAVAGTTSLPAGTYATDLFFSEYIEGSSNNKALEIFNGTGSPVDLGAYKVYLFANGVATPSNTLTFTAGTMLANNEVYVIANAGANLTILAQSDVTSTVTYYNGDDAVALIKVVEGVDTYVDIFGRIGNDPGTAWTADGGYSTLDKTLVRKPTVISGVSVNPTGTGPTAFVTLGTEWDLYTIDTLSYLGAHTFTPGAQVAAAPELTPAGGVYASTVTVTMSTTTPGATIYYTTDGSMPSDTNGFNYSVTGAVAVSATTTIKAITYAPGFTPSPVTTQTYVFPILISNIATLRAQPTGTAIYKLTGEAVLTFQQATRHQKYIQDASAAIVIDDAAGIITTTYSLYDGITGVTGTLGLYSGLLQFTPVADPGAATSHNNTVVPEVRTFASLTTSDQAKLIKVLDVTLDTTTVNFQNVAENINATDPTTTLVMRTFPATDYSLTAIPPALTSLTCLVGQYLTTMQISPRFLADFELPSGLEVPIVQITEAAGTVTLTWAAVSGATSYRVEWASDPYGTYQTLGTTSNLTIDDTSAAKKFYRVRALN